jgi:hypothetical protein
MAPPARIGAAVMMAPAAEADEDVAPPAALVAEPPACEAAELADEATELADEATDDADEDALLAADEALAPALDEAPLAAEDPDAPAPPTAVNRVVEPMVDEPETIADVVNGVEDAAAPEPDLEPDALPALAEPVALAETEDSTLAAPVPAGVPAPLDNVSNGRSTGVEEEGHSLEQ